jgi:predicted ester cyclase
VLVAEEPGETANLQELAMYHVYAGRIIQVWGDLDHARLSR